MFEPVVFFEFTPGKISCPSTDDRRPWASVYVLRRFIRAYWTGDYLTFDVMEECNYSERRGDVTHHDERIRRVFTVSYDFYAVVLDLPTGVNRQLLKTTWSIARSSDIRAAALGVDAIFRECVCCLKDSWVKEYFPVDLQITKP